MKEKNNSTRAGQLSSSKGSSNSKQQKGPKKNLIQQIFKTKNKPINKLNNLSQKKSKLQQKGQADPSTSTHTGKVQSNDKDQREKILEKEKKKQQTKLKKQWMLQEKLRKLNNGEIPTTSRTDGGIKIYKQQDLKIGQGGNTPKCPIDCDCCF